MPLHRTLAARVQDGRKTVLRCTPIASMDAAVIVRSVSARREFYSMAAARFDVLGIGNAIVDVIARTEDDFLIRQNMRKGAHAADR